MRSRSFPIRSSKALRSGLADLRGSWATLWKVLFLLLLALGFESASAQAPRSTAGSTSTSTSGAFSKSSISQLTFDETGSSLQRQRGGLRGEKRLDELTISIGQEAFLNRQDPPAGISDYTLISARLRARTDSQPLSGALDLGGSFATEIENYSNVEVPEAYLAWGERVHQLGGDGFRVVVGRKLQRWSDLDHEWDLGLTQPLNSFDALRPSEQGLAGIYVGGRWGWLEATVFASSVFIPSQGAPYQLNDGRFSSNNPWFSAPPDSLILSSPSRPTPVRYTLEIPDVGSVIDQPSAGLLIRVADPLGQGLYAQASLARKPRNQLALPFAGGLVLTETGTFGSVTVRPQVEFHTVAAADLGYRSPLFAAHLSALVEEPTAAEPDPEFTYQRLDPLRILGGGIEVKAMASKFWGPRLRASYMEAFGGASRSIGPNASNSSPFGARIPYRQAVSFSVASTLVKRATWRMEQAARWIEELAERGTVVMLDSSLVLGDVWNVGLTADFLGSEQPREATSTFIGRFRGNDRVAARVTYFF